MNPLQPIAPRCAIFLVGLLLAPTTLVASTDPDQIPPLRPVRPEIGPGFWEQHGLAVIVIGILLLLLLAILVWFILRPKPQPPIPPEVRVRTILTELKNKPPDPATLTRATQALRAYLAQVLSLPPGEMTTREFREALRKNEKLPATSLYHTCAYLRKADEHKFAPAAQPHPPLLDEALTIVKEIEAALLSPPQNP